MKRNMHTVILRNEDGSSIVMVVDEKGDEVIKIINSPEATQGMINKLAGVEATDG